MTKVPFPQLARYYCFRPLETGIVSAIHVRDGDKITAGQVLIELDRTGRARRLL
ncbi:biotin/lipoyl-binding protein [Bradyrhizobium manausense]|uniref:biotin/lipoyl-binding protein n=1 Tax=Bradyrhizobium manausense TaxID=989370 RepID=UPI003D9AFF31